MKNIPYIAHHRVDTLSPFRTPDFPRRAGLEDGSGLRCLGVFRLNGYLSAYRRHPQDSASDCVSRLIETLLDRHRISRPADASPEMRLRQLVEHLPPAFGADSPAWALALGPGVWQNPGATKDSDRHPLWSRWPRLTLEQGLVMLARTAGGHYHAAREIVFEPDNWLETHVWFAPLLPAMEESP